MIVMEELAVGDPGLAFTLYATNAYITFMAKNCTKEQKDEFITKYVEDDTFLIALGSTEPNARTDNTYPYNAPGGAMQTFAERRGNQYVLNGTKSFITNGACAKLYIIMARMDRKAPITDTLTPFLVPADTPGFSIGKILNKLGMRYQLNSELIMEDARVPVQYRVGEEHKGYQMFRAFRNAVTYKNTILLGTLRKTYEDALDYAKNRVQGGKPIIKHPTIAIKLGAMRANIEAVRLLNT
jgi:alkylation response protein AidB-like acyl-CoA dehydrogenase